MQKFKEKDPRTPVSPQLQKDRDKMHPFLKVRFNFCFVKSRMVKMNIGDSRWPSLREAIHLMRHVSAQLPLTGKKKNLDFSNIFFGCFSVLTSERNETTLGKTVPAVLDTQDTWLLKTEGIVFSIKTDLGW